MELDNRVRDRFSTIVSNYFKADHLNDAKGGDSNDEIVMRSLEFLEDNVCDYAIIMLTHAERMNFNKSIRPHTHPSFYEEYYDDSVGSLNFYKNRYILEQEFDKKNILKATLLITTVVYLLLTVSSFIGQLNYFQICFGAFIAGLAWSFDFPIRRSLLSEIVDKRLYPSAIGLDMTSSNLARVIGPILAGIVLQQVNLFPIYLFGTLMFLMAFVACTRVEVDGYIKKENTKFITETLVTHKESTIEIIKSEEPIA